MSEENEARQIPNDAFTIAWICPIACELQAALRVVDETYRSPDARSNGDNNDYTLARIGHHKVVIFCVGECGTLPAATATEKVKHTFPNIEFYLLVGIAGGVPSEAHDIRLGDIVVSYPNGQSPGVIKHDFGKMESNGFVRIGALNKPHKALLNVVNTLKASFDTINKASVFDLSPHQTDQKQQHLHYPSHLSDVLFQPQQPTDDTGRSSNLIDRPPRESANPLIHYGTIASGDLVVKNQTFRDKFQKDDNILCFEMEAAGLMDSYQSLVIRGICDYADSAKNKDWQPYAASVAAEYAKAVLARLPGSSSKPVLYKLNKEEQKCLQLFRQASTTTSNASYEWYKDSVKKASEDTCKWLKSDPKFEQWLSANGTTLVITALPGCGKSVLSRHLVDSVLPDRTDATICYFFFKDGDQNTLRQALCALLHQLLAANPSLHAMSSHERNGDSLINSVSLLWIIWQSATHDPAAGHVITILDGLDECQKDDTSVLLERVSEHANGKSNVQYLVTSRPYESILTEVRSMFGDGNYYHVSADEKSEAISEEVKRVIKSKVSQLAKSKRLSPDATASLAERIDAMKNVTYLWVRLVFDYLSTVKFNRTRPGIEEVFKRLTSSVYS
ncbi:hypothetical protein TD95_001038, partial [Thielaviopsis punctulata]